MNIKSYRKPICGLSALIAVLVIVNFSWDIEVLASPARGEPGAAVAHLLADEALKRFKVSTKVSSIPQAVRRKLSPNGNFEMASAEEPFTAGCVRHKGDPPHSRMGICATTPDACIISCENGGFALRRIVEFFEIRKGKATMIATAYVSPKDWPVNELSKLKRLYEENKLEFIPISKSKSNKHQSKATF